MTRTAVMTDAQDPDRPVTIPGRNARSGERTGLTIRVGGGRREDELLSLRDWLTGEPDLRGRLELLKAPPTPGTLGAATDAIAVALGPSGAVTVLASALIAWLRRRVGDVTV